MRASSVSKRPFESPSQPSSAALTATSTCSDVTSYEVRRRREALVPLGRIGTARDVGEAVVFLATDGAAYINGVDLLVDGGVADHMLALIPGRPGQASPVVPTMPAGEGGAR